MTKKEYSRLWYLENRERVLKRVRDYRLNNNEKVKEYHKSYYLINMEESKKRAREQRLSGYIYKTPKEKKREYQKRYEEKNKEKLKEHHSVYYKNNKHRFSYSKNKYLRQISDPLKKIVRLSRARISNFLKSRGMKKSKSTIEMIGCSPEEFKKHLESLFVDNMNRDNYGFYGWHIDHIIPLAIAKTKEDILKLCNYRNLQPLWWQDNFMKNKKSSLTKDFNFKKLYTS